MGVVCIWRLWPVWELDMDLIGPADNGLKSGSHETLICQIARNRLSARPGQGFLGRTGKQGKKASPENNIGRDFRVKTQMKNG